MEVVQNRMRHYHAFLEEYSYDDISKIPGINANNVGVRINRIKSKLENMMKHN